MKARALSLLLGLLAAGLVGVVLVTFRSTEPEYDGQPLNQWLREMENVADPTSEHWLRAAHAVGQIGTNALPSLVAMLQQPDSQWTAQAVDWLQDNADLDLTEALGSIRGRRALVGFRLLGSAAAPAVPQIAELALDRDPRVSGQALAALGEIGSRLAIPPLLTVLTNGQLPARLQAVTSLGALRSQAADAIPMLLNGLADPDADLRAAAARALGEIALDAPRVVPALTAALADTNAAVRTAAVVALGNFGDQAAAAIPAVRAFGDKLDEFGRRLATRTLIRLQCQMREGAILRGPKSAKRIALVFTGHEHAEGGETILNELARRGGQASFFFTGEFLANSNHAPLLARLVAERHYLGPHSDQHLLYCAWEDRRTLIPETEFATDLLANMARLPPRPGQDQRFGRYFLPPFEHYNREIADWTRKLRWTLINYTPGTRSHADYTGEADKNFTSSQAILDSIVKQERDDPNGLNGFLLLLHVGSGPGRADKFHARFGELLDSLAGKGYEFVRVDHLLAPRPPSP